MVLSVGHREDEDGAAALVAEKENEIEKVESNSNNARGLLRDFVDAEKSSSSSSASRPRRSRRHRAHVKYVAGLHGDEPSGRQLLVALAEYICAFDPKLAAAELAARRSGNGNGGVMTTATTTGGPQIGRHSDPRVAALLSRTVLHLAPAINPDGFDLRRRENAAGVDLNRDFPDPLELRRGVPVGRLFGNESSGSSSSSAFVGSLPGRSPDPDADDVDLSPRGTEQPETLALMRWMTPEANAATTSSRHRRTSFRFVASAALHEGALVANYPWDGTPDGSTRYAACPDDATFRWLASSYADRSPAMTAGPEFGRGVARLTDDGLVVPRDDGGSSSSSSTFSSSSSSPNNGNTVPDPGTTNGAAWYPLRGGMQDWNYLQASCFELTLELAQSKWPAPALLPRMFAENLDPLLAYPVAASAGAHGVVLSGERKGADKGGGDGGDKGGGGERASSTSPPPPPPAGTTVRVRGLRGAPPALPDPLTGAWFRPLSPGNYVLSVAAPGTQPVEAEVEVGGGSGSSSSSGGRGGEGSGSGGGGKLPSSSAAKLTLDRSPDLEVTLREQGSTARLVEVSSVVSVVPAAASGAAVAVPLAKTKATATTAASLLGGRKAAGLASSSPRSRSLSGDAAAFGLQVALAVGAMVALVAVARRAAAGRRGEGGRGGASVGGAAGASNS